MAASAYDLILVQNFNDHIEVQEGMSLFLETITVLLLILMVEKKYI